MTEKDVEQTLREAFAAQARAAVGDTEPPPPPRFATEPRARRRTVRLLAPLAAAAAVVAVGGIVALTQQSGSGGHHDVAGGRSTGSKSAPNVLAAPTAFATGPTAPSMTSATELPSSVHIRLYNRDGETYGVGMPVVAIFDKTVADGRSFARATQVTVDGKPIQAAWYFQHSPEALGAMEAHLRPEGYWPAHADVHVTLNTKGLSAGRGRTYDDSLSLDFRTGAQNIVTVDGRTHTLTVTSDGRPMGSYPVSLGAVKTLTFNGTKVIMDKAAKARLKGPGFDQLAPYAQQLTYSGEYLIGAPWNQAGITSKVDTSNGCTNLSLADAARLYRLLRVGDVVRYVNTTGAQMPPSDGFGDWNVPWSDWVGGGLLPTK